MKDLNIIVVLLQCLSNISLGRENDNCHCGFIKDSQQRSKWISLMLQRPYTIQSSKASSHVKGIPPLWVLVSLFPHESIWKLSHLSYADYVALNTLRLSNISSPSIIINQSIVVENGTNDPFFIIPSMAIPSEPYIFGLNMSDVKSPKLCFCGLPLRSFQFNYTDFELSPISKKALWDASSQEFKSAKKTIEKKIYNHINRSDSVDVLQLMYSPNGVSALVQILSQGGEMEGSINTALSLKEIQNNIIDGQLNLKCMDGGLTPSNWLIPQLCISVPYCQISDTQSVSRLGYQVNSFTSIRIPTGDSLYLLCASEDAMVEDGAGRNHLELKCKGNATSERVEFSLPNPSFYPQCIERCRGFTSISYAERLDNPFLEYFANASILFRCLKHFHLRNKGYTDTNFSAVCLKDGSLIPSGICTPIPCTVDQINSACPDDFKPLSPKNILPNQQIKYICSDSTKVPNSGRSYVKLSCEWGGSLTNTTWPLCISKCNDHPNISGLIPVRKTYVKAGDFATYKCVEKDKIPDSGYPFRILCHANGTFQSILNPPICISGCFNIPSVAGFKSTSLVDQRPNASLKFICSHNRYIEHNGQHLFYTCRKINGSYSYVLNENITSSNFPVCVSPTKCLPHLNLSLPSSYKMKYPLNITYNSGENIDIACSAKGYVPEKEPILAKCKDDLQFELPVNWSICIPSVCSQEEIQSIRNGSLAKSCQCSFSKCTEFIFDSIMEQCPQESNKGPPCALIKSENYQYGYYYEDAHAINISSAVSNYTIRRMNDLAMDLSLTRDRLLQVKECKRRKRRVPIYCKEFKKQMEGLTSLLRIGHDKLNYNLPRISHLHLFLRQSNLNCPLPQGPIRNFSETINLFKDDIQYLKTNRTKMIYLPSRNVTLSKACNTSIILGLRIHGLQSNGSFNVEKCCCKDIDESFILKVTLQSPWKQVLRDPKSEDTINYKIKVEKDMEIIFSKSIIRNKLHHWTLQNISKSAINSRIEITFHVHLSEPHWNNDARLIKAFDDSVYGIQNDSTKLNTSLLHFVYEHSGGPQTSATKIKMIDTSESNTLHKNNNSIDSNETNHDNGIHMAGLISMTVLGAFLIVIILMSLLSSKACKCREWI
ncbi:uncharacterized protein [Lepeophtheirus salmonis]|uniref:uncharacterized protein isoform X2 n=1 Tax=Lepeophtheirus salmonis TaxID=72036 RepID=UPI003AF35E9B